MILLPVTYSQLDDRWSKDLLGFNTDITFNIFNYGCLLTCLAMVLKYYGFDTDPKRLNDLLKGVHGFEPNSGVYDWGSLSKLVPAISEQHTKTPNPLSDVQMGEIKTALDKGYPVILQIDYNPKTVESNMHFVVAIGYSLTDENDITITDPLGGKIHSLKDYLGWFKPSARNSIDGYSVVAGQVPAIADQTGVIVAKDIFPILVYKSTQWDKIVDKYKNGFDPKTTSFDDVANVMGGVQSIATTAQRANDKLTAQNAELQAQVKSLSEQLAHSEDERKAELKTHLAQLDALKPNTDSTKALIQTYEDRIKGYQDQIQSLISDKKDLTVDNVKLSNTSTASLASLISQQLPTFTELLKRLKQS